MGLLLGEPYIGIPMKAKSIKTKVHEELCNPPVSTGSGYINGAGYVTGPMGLSVTRPEFRSITKILRWCDVQDLLIRKD